nr:chromosome segregation protein SMC [Oceanococcus sp. HetDA_MAG_MS8]
MRLSAIRLAGFKSFVDRTELRLSSNLTSIVGPNGCGKSNLIDAVRWVLGESSARQLRGSSLEDVIFSGSRTRKPVGRASIELVFDNSDNTLVGQWGAYTEVAVRRELSRDGQSVFYINGQKCRRKDVTELFLGTGLGPRANYAIIEQGTISRLVEAQPDDLRGMLEEAAGVSRYKEKRRETEIRIRHTRENLERLNDLVSEIDDRLAKLKRQVRAAERYKEYRSQQRGLRAALYGLRWRELEQAQQGGDNTIAQANSAADATRQDLTDAMVAVQNTEQAQTAKQAAKQQADEAFYTSQAELARIDQELAHQQQLRSVREDELKQLRSDAQRQQSALEQAREEHKRADAALQEMDAELQQLTSAEEGEDQRQSTAAEALSAAQQSLLEARRAAEEPRANRAREQARLEQLRSQQQQLQRRLAQLEQELDQLRQNPPQGNLEALAAELSRLQQQRGDAEQAQDRATARLQSAREQRQAAQQAQQAALASRNQAQARRDVLQAEQERSLRAADRNVEKQLRDQGMSWTQVLGEVLQVPAGRETAVEAVLREWLQAPLVERLPQAQLPTASAVITASVETLPDAPEQCLAYGVHAPAAVLAMLQDVAFVPDVNQVAEALQRYRACALPNGEMRWAGAVRAASTDDESGGVLLRQKALQEAQSRWEQAQASAESAEASLRQAQEELSAAESAWSATGQQLNQVRHQLNQAQAQIDRAQAEHDRHGKRLEDCQAALQASQKDQQTLDVELEQRQSALRAAEAELEQREVVAQQADQSWREAQQQAQGLQQQLQALRQKLNALRGQREQWLRRRAAAESQVSARTQSLENLQTAMTRAEQALQELPLEQSRGHQREEAAAVHAAKVDARNQAQQALQQAQQQHQQAQKALEQARAANEAALQALQEAKLEREGLRSRLEALREQMQEHGLSPRTAQEAVDEDHSLRGVQQALEELENKLTRLGAVNLAAVEEFAEESARAEDLRKQDADLRAALEQLESAMAQIDRETRALFKKTYDTVNAKFQERFPRLFGGGEAGLELMGDDVLSAGVKVMARPPGKRNASIALLSGGEKALTAVALVFALFELNPAPFCMLDEVDAPLDDANVVRFCDVVREMSEHVQFIVVTHNKVTMEMADALHGVTMQEAGVSRLVGVDVSAAVAMTEEPA